MSRLDDRIDFKPVTKGDLPRLLSWFAEPHVAAWWGEPGEEVALVRDMIDGLDSTRPFIIQLDGQPVGYLQYWSLGELQTEEWVEDHPWLTAFPPEAVGIDIAIGEPNLTGHGIGPAALGLFARRLVDSGYPIIVMDPDPDNDRALRAFEKAGFAPVSEPGIGGDDVLIIQFRSH